MEYLDTEWLYFTASDINRARECILEHKQAEVRFRGTSFQTMVGQIHSKDLSGFRIHNGYVKDTKFDHIKINSVSFNGSKFQKSNFHDCEIDDTSMQSCSFSDSEFIRCGLHGSNMSQSFIWNTKFYKSKIEATTLLQSVIANSSFDSCLIKSVSFEGCLINETNFTDMRLSDLNLEYAEFRDICSHNVVYPFAQMPYTFGGLRYVLDTNDKVAITSKKNGQSEISTEEYRSVFDDLVILFWANKDYFPLANIFDSLGRKELSAKALQSGVFSSLQARNFRMLKYYCKLASQIGTFGTADKRRLYLFIESYIQRQDIRESEYFDYFLHQPDIKRLLLDSFSAYLPCSIFFTTNVDSADYIRLSSLLEIFDEVYELLPVQAQQKKMELRHNSDFIMEIFHMLPPEYSLVFIGLICVVIGLKTAANITRKIQEIIHAGKKERREHNEIKVLLNREKREQETHDAEMGAIAIQKQQLVEKHAVEMKLMEQQLIKIVNDNEVALLEKKKRLAHHEILISSLSAVGDSRYDRLLG